MPAAGYQKIGNFTANAAYFAPLFVRLTTPASGVQTAEFGGTSADTVQYYLAPGQTGKDGIFSATFGGGGAYGTRTDESTGIISFQQQANDGTTTIFLPSAGGLPAPYLYAAHFEYSYAAAGINYAQLAFFGTPSEPSELDHTGRWGYQLATIVKPKISATIPANVYGPKADANLSVDWDKQEISGRVRIVKADGTGEIITEFRGPYDKKLNSFSIPFTTLDPQTGATGTSGLMRGKFFGPLGNEVCIVFQFRDSSGRLAIGAIRGGAN